MALFDLFRRPQPVAVAGSLAESGLAFDVEYLTERLAELELALEDQEWEKAGSRFDREFTREGLGKIIAASRLATLKNPVINRPVTLQAQYVWAQGISISGRHDLINETIQAFLDDEANKAELTTHQQRTMKEIELQATGNLFFVFFTDISTGAVKVRTIEVEEIQDIITNPQDRREPWFYKRVYSTREIENGRMGAAVVRTVYHPDWKATKEKLPQEMADGEIDWEHPVYHVKVGGFSHMRFGIPETYAALDWARAYKEFLEDWATIVRSLSRFAWKMTAKGGARGVAASKTKLQTTLGVGGSPETNPAPTTAAVYVGSEGNDLTPMPKTGATVAADDGRRLLLMVAAAVGLPETFFGDAAVGTLATAKSLDRPTELKFIDRQELWKDIFNNILQYAIDQAARAVNGRLASGDQVDLGTDGNGEEIDRTLDIEFPPLLEHDPVSAMAAVVSAVTLDGKAPAKIFDLRTIIRWIARAIGEDDVDALLDSLAPLEGEPTVVPFEGVEPPEDGAFVETVRELREAMRKA